MAQILVDVSVVESWFSWLKEMLLVAFEDLSDAEKFGCDFNMYAIAQHLNPVGGPVGVVSSWSQIL